MAIFELGGYVPTTSVGTVASIVFNSGSVNTASRDVTVVNNGSVTVYVGGGSAAACTTTSAPVASGGQLTIQSAAVTLWANTAVVGTTASVTAGLATVASVV